MLNYPNDDKNFMKNFIFALVFLILNSALYSYSNQGSYLINYSSTGHKSVNYVETNDDGYVYVKNKTAEYKILPGTNVEFTDSNNYVLKKGAIVINKSVFNYGLFKRYSAARKFFLDNEQGFTQFYRISIPKAKKFDCSGKIIYFIKNESGENKILKKELNVKLHQLFEKNRKNYLGFFIPLNLYWNIIKIEIEIDINYNNSLFVKIKDGENINDRDWQKQVISFRQEKSKELVTTNISKFRAEEEDRKKIYSENNPDILFNEGYIYPVDEEIYITSEFGAVREWKLNNGRIYMKNIHDGLDIAKPGNFNIYAPSDGIVRYSAKTEFFGNMLMLEHGFSCFTSYAHLDKALVKPKAKVKKGELIAIAGNTGAATGIHLHWGARIYGITVDPRSFLKINEIFIP
jgi:hypothetical protein